MKTLKLGEVVKKKVKKFINNMKMKTNKIINKRTLNLVSLIKKRENLIIQEKMAEV